MPRRFALALALPFLAYAQSPDLAVDRSTLPNGLDLLLHTDRKAPIVHINIRIHAGSKHEKPGQFGIAHLTEHATKGSISSGSVRPPHPGRAPHSILQPSCSRTITAPAIFTKH